MVHERIANLNDESKSNGSLIIDLEDTCLRSSECDLLKDPRVGGVIFFTRNFKSPEQLSELTAEVRALRPGLILTVDQEGGRVQRFRNGVSRLPSFAQLAQAGEDACEQLAWFMAQEVLALGVDLSFTPVLDINYGRNSVIGDRAFGADGASVIRCARAYLRGLSRAGMPATGKHFPGHGWVELDSHFELPVDERSFDEMSDDINVFQQLSPQLSAIMTAHILYQQFDTKIATYSKKWLDFLKQDLGFKGVIISDDLAMAAATGIESVQARATAALDAGCHMLLMCNNRPAVLELLDSDGQWYTSQSLEALRGATSYDFAHLSTNEEYKDIRERLLDTIG